MTPATLGTSDLEKPSDEALGCALPRGPSRDVLNFFRRDRERTSMPAHDSIDWDHIDPQHRLFVLGAIATDFLFGKLIPAGYASRYWLDFCHGRVIRAPTLVADHRTVITKRMHCHTLATTVILVLANGRVVHDREERISIALHAEEPQVAWPATAVILCVRGGEAGLTNCIDRLAAVEYPDVEIQVVVGPGQIELVDYRPVASPVAPSPAAGMRLTGAIAGPK